MPTENLVNLTVLNRPDLKNHSSNIKPRDRKLMRSTYNNLMLHTFENNLKIDEDYCWNNGKGFDNFVADFAGHRKELLKLMGDSKNFRRASWTELKKLKTVNGAFAPSNLAFSIPSIPPTKAKTKYNKNNEKARTKLVRFKTEDDRTVSKISHSYQFNVQTWSRTEKLIPIKLYHMPPDLRLLIGAESSSKVTLKDRIKALGGEYYRALEWMYKNESDDIEKAAEESIKQLAEELKGKFNLKEALDKLAASYPQITKSEIIDIILEVYNEKTGVLNKGKLHAALTSKASKRLKCTLWTSIHEKQEFDSRQQLAEHLGYTSNYIASLISTGNPTGNGQYVTNGDLPEALFQQKYYHVRMTTLAHVLGEGLKDFMSPMELEVVSAMISEDGDLDKIAKMLNIKPEIVEETWEAAMLNLDRVFKILSRHTKNEIKDRLAPIQGDSQTRFNKLSEIYVSEDSNNGDEEFNEKIREKLNTSDAITVDSTRSTSKTNP